MPGSETPRDLLSLEDVDARRSELTRNIQSIQAQLGDKQRVGENGKRLNSEEYWAWKKKAQGVLNQKLEELRTIKKQLREHYSSVAPVRHDAHSHVANLHGILVELAADGVDMEDGEQQKIDAAEKYLRHAR